MRGTETKQVSMLCLMSPETMVPSDHPLRRIKRMSDEILRELSTTFDGMYSGTGRPSIPPERLLKGSLLIALYSLRGERMLCDQLQYNMLFRWFLGMSMLDEVFERTAFAHNRERLMEHDVAGEFFRRVLEKANRAKLMSNEHFTVDGTLIDAWASLKSFKRKDDDSDPPPPDDRGNPTVNFHGESRRNDTHESTTDPQSRLARKGSGKEAKLSFSAHALMENRNGLLVDFRIAEANGYAERETALAMLEDIKVGVSPITVGADKGYDTRNFVAECRAINVIPHVASKQRSAVDGRTTRHAGYAVSQRIRKRVEEIFGWMKTVGGFRRTRYKGKPRTQFAAYLVGAAYNLLRVANLLAAAEVA